MGVSFYVEQESYMVKILKKILQVKKMKTLLQQQLYIGGVLPYFIEFDEHCLWRVDKDRDIVFKEEFILSIKLVL